MRVGIESDIGPLFRPGSDGRSESYAVDLVNAISRETGFGVIYQEAPWSELLARFKAGELDVLAGVTHNAERDRFIDYSVHHLDLKGVAFVRRGAPALRTAADLGSLRIAVQRDGFTHEFLRRNGWDRQLIFVPSTGEALKAVAEGRSDAVLTLELIGKKIIREQKLADIEASGVPLPDLSFRLHLGVQAGDTDRLRLLNEGLAGIRANGVYDSIHEKWIGPLNPRPLRLQDPGPFAVPAIVAMLAFGAVFFWQRHLLIRFRKQAAELQQSQQRLRLVLEIGAHGLWDYDYPSKTPQHDQSWRLNLMGFTAADLAANPDLIRNRIHPDDRPRMAAADARVATGHDDVVMDYRVQTKAGDWRWISSRGRVTSRAPDGKPLRAVGTNTDVTHLKRQEAERAELQAKMLEAQKLESLGVLAGGIAHDFNNLLAVILGNASLIRQDLPSSHTAKRNLDQIEVASRRASDLCRQMLAYAGQGTFAREHVSLVSLIANTTELLRLSIGKHVTIDFELDPATPGIEADRTQMQQVVMNLVINASEAISPPSGNVKLRTGRGRIPLDELVDAVHRPEQITGDFAWLEVTDSGCGMTPETRAKIFEPFFTTKFTGRGLGLAAVLGIVRAHRGVFIVRSTPGQGSTFRIFLPAAAPKLFAEPAPAKTNAPALPPAPAPRPESSALTILVADDEANVLSMVKHVLERSGHRVVVAHNGREAVEIFAARRYEFGLVLLDLTMPVLGGAEALVEIRALNSATRLIMMSGYGQSDVLRPLRANGRVGFIAKPFSADELLAAIAQMMATTIPGAKTQTVESLHPAK